MGNGAIGKALPRYKAQAEDEQPVEVTEPSLQLCKVNEGVLTVPQDLRGRYLSDPVRAPEWRRLLSEFDARWSSTGSGASSTPAKQPVTGAGEGDTVVVEASTAPCSDAFDWAAVYLGEPRKKEDMISTYGEGAHSFTINGTLMGVIVEGPKLFLVSSGQTSLSGDSPLLFFGAGSWLLDAKATSYAQDREALFCAEILTRSKAEFADTGAPHEGVHISAGE